MYRVLPDFILFTHRVISSDIGASFDASFLSYASILAMSTVAVTLSHF